MRKHKKILVALLAVAALVAMIVPVGTASAGSWSVEQITHANIPDARLDHVFVLPSDTDNVWIVGERNDDTNVPVILRSTDGGTTWTNATTPATMDQDIDGLYFASATEGWFSAGAGYIYHTTDGGANWTLQTSDTDQALYAIEFLADGDTGVAVGFNGAVTNTTDGGATWTAETLTSTGGSQMLFGVELASNDVWYAVGKAGNFFKSTNGGDTWTNNPGVGLGEEIAAEFFFDCAAPSATEAYIGTQSGIIVKTADGTTWTSIASSVTGASSVYAIDAIGAGKVWACGGAGKLIYTEDGGTTWNTKTTGMASNLRHLDFVAGEVGYVVGDGGAVFKVTFTPALPTAAFSADVVTAVVDTDVTFTDASTGGVTAWAWDFGDDSGTSTVQDPVYAYDTAGTYTVTLTVTNEDGDDELVKTDYITITGAGCCASAAATAADIGSSAALVGMLGLMATYFHFRKRRS
ncbi:YCF48-related protein [Chloroflexota bacterium]